MRMPGSFAGLKPQADPGCGPELTVGPETQHCGVGLRMMSLTATGERPVCCPPGLQAEQLLTEDPLIVF